MTKGARVCPRPECGETHHIFAKCKDGVKVYTYTTTGATHAKKPRASSKRKEVEVAIGSAPGVTASADLREQMVDAVVADENGTADAVPKGFVKSKGILVPTDPAAIAEIMADNERYRMASEHAAAERALGVMLPIPKELRRPNSDGANALLAQIGDVRKKQAEYQTKEVSVDQALATSGMLRDVLEAREAQKSAAANPPKPEIQRTEGEYPWRCMEMKCRQRFRSLSIEGARRKAKAEPNWKLQCPECGSLRVIQEMEGAA